MAQWVLVTYVNVTREVSEQGQTNVDEQVRTAACDAVDANRWDCKKLVDILKLCKGVHTEDGQDDEENGSNHDLCFLIDVIFAIARLVFGLRDYRCCNKKSSGSVKSS